MPDVVGLHAPGTTRFAGGAVAGMAATWVMLAAQAALMERLMPAPASGGPPAPDPPPVRMASRFSSALLHRGLTEAQKPRAATLVNYTGGTLIGGTFGVVRPMVPGRGLAPGLLMGATAWLMGDEVVGPLAGVADSPKATPPKAQAIDLAAHLVFGVATDALRGLLIRAT